MVTVPPGNTPLTSPDPSTVAIAELLLHVPPGTLSVSVIVLPVHTLKVLPPNAAGEGVTVTSNVVVQLPIV